VQPISYTAGCDWDAFHPDGGVSNSVVQYNYSHNNFGPEYLRRRSQQSPPCGPRNRRHAVMDRLDGPQPGPSGYQPQSASPVKSMGANLLACPSQPKVLGARDYYGNSIFRQREKEGTMAHWTGRAISRSAALARTHKAITYSFESKP